MKPRHALFCIIFAALTLSAIADDAVLLETSGVVQLKRSGSAEWMDASTGLVLKSEDVVRTGAHSRAIVILPDDTRVDLFSNSELTIGDQKDAQSGAAASAAASADQKIRSLVGLLWNTVKEKLADTRFLSASVGSVGALRGPGIDEEKTFDDSLGESEKEELAAGLKEISAQKLDSATSLLLKAVLYEWYGQYTFAETAYRSVIDAKPEDPITYEMLIEMYIEIDMISHAQQTLSVLHEIQTY